MSYERDKNAHTRGPGAIAAYDRNPARRVRRAQGARASLRRDRRMIGVMNGLGALSTVTVASTQHTQGGDIGGYTHGGGGTVVRAPSVVRALGIKGPVTVAGSTTAPTSGGFNIIGSPGGTTSPPPSCQPGYIYDSKLLQCVVPPGTTTTSGGSSGGGTVTTTGGDTGTTTTIPPPDSTPPPPPVDTTEIPPGDDITPTPVAASSIDLGTLALIGAAGLVAYFLFLRKKPGGA